MTIVSFFNKFPWTSFHQSRYKDTWACQGGGAGDSSGEGERGRVWTLWPRVQKQVVRRRSKGKSCEQRERVENWGCFEQKFVRVGRFVNVVRFSWLDWSSLLCRYLQLSVRLAFHARHQSLSTIIIVVVILFTTNLFQVDGASENRKRKHGRISPITWENPSNEEKKSADNTESEFHAITVVITTS